MIITVTYYGRLTELIGKSTESVKIEEVSVEEIRKTLEKSYPSLRNMTYQLAANNSILKEEDTFISDRLDVFPPFSGG